ncbi:MAG: sulfatase-like hydrolase/transferase, partial [Phycisphaerae bacterium]
MAVSCLLVAAGCGRPPAGPPSTPNFNVVLISIDTTRADRLGCYGFAGAKTPNIDRLAREGVLLEQCITSAPLTLPAHASLLTATEPFVHKLRDNAIFQLQPAIETLAETLRQAGWRTHAETAAFVLNREFGLDQGFETYNDVRSSA